MLNRGFLPDDLWIAWMGAVITLLGVLFAIWARFTIGKEWSAEVQIKEGHQLIRTGPYAHIRHPIYTGILLALCGTAIAIGEYRAILGLVLFLSASFAKQKKKSNSSPENLARRLRSIAGTPASSCRGLPDGYLALAEKVSPAVC